MKYYTLYNKDDEYLFGGTAKECADFLGIKYDTFMKQKTRCRVRNSKIIIFEIEDESIEYVPNLWLLKCIENCSIKMNEMFYFKRNELINSRIDRQNKYLCIFKNGCIISLPLRNEKVREFLKHFKVKKNRYKNNLLD